MARTSPALWVVLLVLLLVCGGSGGSGVWAQKPSPSPSASPSPSPKKDAELYALLLKDPATLGCRPDSALFHLAYQRIASTHADNPSDSQLFGGVAREVRVLLELARVGSDGLDDLPLDRHLPEQIAARWGSRVDGPLLWYVMIRGLFKGTGDEHSYMMRPLEYRRLMETLQNSRFVGVGIFVELDRDNHEQLTVIEPVEDGPAARAGVQARDEIIRINGRSTDHTTVEAASTLIRGERGTKVTLTVRRAGVIKDIVVERNYIKIPSVTSQMLDGGIGYVRIRIFGSATQREFREALDALLARNARGLILDLRNNGGGYNTSAVDVCSHFLRPNELVTYMIDKRGGRREYRGGRANPIRLPLAVLVNKYSASASEIMVGCLKDRGAAVIGTRTYGKGSSQQLTELVGGAGMRITFAHFYSPKGTRIDKVGIEPTETVDMDVRYAMRPEKDVQLKRAIEVLAR